MTVGRRAVLRGGGALIVASVLAGPRRAVAGAPAGEALEVELEDIAPGEIVVVEWQRQPIFLRRLTGEERRRARSVPLDTLRDPEEADRRIVAGEWVVVVGACTHGGCEPVGPTGRYGGWFCFCHGSQFDPVGRIREGPARRNLDLPPFELVGESRLRIGVSPAEP